MLGNRRLPGRPLILVGVAVAALLAGAGVAMAATSGSPASGTGAASPGGLAATPSPPARPALPDEGRPGEGRRPGEGFFGFGGPFSAVHGQFVVPKSGGGYQTIDTQRGSVTAVSDTSITVKSADGFAKTYQVTSSTNVDAERNGIGSVKTGHQVAVTATVSGGTATAVSILDFSLLPSLHGGFGWHHAAPPTPPAAGSG